MIEPSTAQAVYNDMGALADLRGRARANPNDAVEEVAQQFEALFIQMMLKSMRDAVEDGGCRQRSGGRITDGGSTNSARHGL